MNEIGDTFILLAGDTFMHEMHLRQPAMLGQPGFTYSACRPFSKTK